MNQFREDDEIIITQRRVDEFCKKYSAPPSKVKSVLMQANIRLMHAIVLPYWATEVIQKTDITHISQQREARPIVRNMLREHICTELEQKYRQKICHVDYSFTYIDGQYHIFVITIFENPIFCNDDAATRSMETQHAGLLAKSLRGLTGRGPKKTRAIYMNAGLVVYIINGLISSGDKIFASKSIDNAEHVEKIAEHNLKEAFTSIYLTDNAAINNITIIDIENDCSISLVFTKEKVISSTNERIVSEYCHKQCESISLSIAR